MVGVADIPCVGKIVDRISDATVGVLFRGLNYMFCYKTLIEVLNSEIENIDIEEARVSRNVVAEKASGKTIEDHVNKWQKDVKEIQESSKELMAKCKTKSSWRCFQCLPIPNPASRFHLGREAAKKAKRITELTDFKLRFMDNEIAYIPAVVNFPNPDNAFGNFQSRSDSYAELWEALVNESSSLVHGIYGMAGVGKTRMMEEIWDEAVKKGIFQNVTRADLSSEKLDVKKVQDQIAGYLKCKFESADNVVQRASQLKESLMIGGKILIIFDNVWEEIPLDSIIGSSFGDASESRGSKILLTSRKKDVCFANKCEHPIEIIPLNHLEALDLFKNTIGTNRVDSALDDTLVQEVCRKCAGLPLLICAVGKALQFATYHIWKDALYKLNNCRIESVPGIGPTEYSCLKLSYDNLVEDAKRCLLLASLFPEDSEIPISTLIRIATGSQLLECKSVRAMIDILKSSSLLLQGIDDQHFKLHDVIRGVARSIAIKDCAFSFTRCGSRLPHNSSLYETRKVLHLEVDKNDFSFPDDLVCPNLHTLWLRSTAFDWAANTPLAGPGNTFQPWDLSSMFGNLEFLVLVKCSWEPPFSLKPLDKLRTLILDRCDIGQTDATFFPENLETLCIGNCHLPKLLELPNLKSLLTLEIIHWPKTPLFVAPKVISSLIRLEELHILNGFYIIDKAMLNNVVEPGNSSDQSKEGDNCILDEICKLTQLTSLQISLSKSEHFLCTNKLFKNLLEFNIWVGLTEDWEPPTGHPASSVSKKVDLFHYQSKGLDSVVGSAEEVLMFRSHVDMSSILSDNKEAFAGLRSLHIVKCNKMEHLARISHQEIQHSRQPLSCFSKLVSLKITNCSAMEYLFCSSVAQCFLQLQKLRLKDCPQMEAIVMKEGTCDADVINFPKLKSLKLRKVPRLKSFCMEKTPLMDNFANQWVQSRPLFDGMVIFPCLEKLKLMGLKDITDIWGKHSYNDNVSCFSQIKMISIGFCDQLKVVIPHAMLHRLQNLYHLRIVSCESLVSEVGTCGSSTVVCPLLALKTLRLYSLPYLTITGLNSREICGATTLYPNLEYLGIERCGLTRVFLPSIARDLIHLKQMYVEESDTVEGIIVGRADEEILSDKIIFPELIKLRLNVLENLKSFWCNPSGEANTYKVEFPKLVDYELRIQDPDHSEPKELGMMIPPVN